MPAEPELKEYPLHGEGVRGVVLSAARFLDESPHKRVRLEDGTELLVPSDNLEPQPDGSFRLSRPLEQRSAPAVSDALYRHGYKVERVPVDRVVSERPAPRPDGEAMVFPVVEEVLVVEKRLVLREEIRVSPESSPLPPSPPRSSV